MGWNVVACLVVLMLVLQQAGLEECARGDDESV